MGAICGPSSKLVTLNGSHLRCEGETFDPSSKYKGEKIMAMLAIKLDVFFFSTLLLYLEHLKQFVATLALARDQGKGVARLRAYK